MKHVCLLDAITFLKLHYIISTHLFKSLNKGIPIAFMATGV